MPEHFLHRAQIARGLQHVRPETNGAACAGCVHRQPSSSARRLRRTWMARIDNRFPLRPTNSAGSSAAASRPGTPPFAASASRLGTDGNDPRLAALADTQNLATGDIAGQSISSPVEFGQTQAGGIEQLENRLVANRQQVPPDRRRPAPAIGFVHGGASAARLSRFFGGRTPSTVLRCLAAQAEPAIETAPRRRHAGQRCGRRGHARCAGRRNAGCGAPAARWRQRSGQRRASSTSR